MTAYNLIQVRTDVSWETEKQSFDEPKCRQDDFTSFWDDQHTSTINKDFDQLIVNAVCTTSSLTLNSQYILTTSLSHHQRNIDTFHPLID